MFLLIIVGALTALVNIDFNTSHVSINQPSERRTPPDSDISIHLMFLLIECTGGCRICNRHFNTSHVSINLQKLFAYDFQFAFQYISCFY